MHFLDHANICNYLRTQVGYPVKLGRRGQEEEEINVFIVIKK